VLDANRRLFRGTGVHSSGNEIEPACDTKATLTDTSGQPISQGGASTWATARRKAAFAQWFHPGMRRHGFKEYRSKQSRGFKGIEASPNPSGQNWGRSMQRARLLPVSNMHGLKEAPQPQFRATPVTRWTRSDTLTYPPLHARACSAERYRRHDTKCHMSPSTQIPTAANRSVSAVIPAKSGRSAVSTRKNHGKTKIWFTRAQKKGTARL